jgi:hypothetical protein
MHGGEVLSIITGYFVCAERTASDRRLAPKMQLPFCDASPPSPIALPVVKRFKMER